MALYNVLDGCNPWPHVANRHISISQLLSSCSYLFTVSNSGLLSVQRPRPASHAHFRHSHIPELIFGVNSSTDAMLISKALRLVRVNEGSNGFACHLYTFIRKWNELSCLYSSAAEHRRTLAGTHFPSR